MVLSGEDEHLETLVGFDQGVHDLHYSHTYK